MNTAAEAARAAGVRTIDVDVQTLRAAIRPDKGAIGTTLLLIFLRPGDPWL